ncbi:MAG: sensor histidine kinase [Chitinophagaceae bacterium]|nr:MAG: sensor histidine kinase [Chitinophagaceae bacterium]
MPLTTLISCTTRRTASVSAPDLLQTTPLPTSLYRSVRSRLFFGIGWWAIAQFQFLLELHFDLPFGAALTDSLAGTLLLAGVCWLLDLKLRFYIPERQKALHLIALCAVLTGVWLFVLRWLLALLLPASFGDFFYASIWFRGAFGLLITGFMALLSVLWYTLQERAATERRRSEAEALSRDAELANLRQQLQPHFLFNSLNSINTLIGMQPDKARRMVQQLSDFLRGTLKQDQRQWMPFEEELAHLSLYLDIEKVRFGHRLQTEVANKSSGMLIPVLLLQPVVENAIKFGLYDTTDAITIDIRAWPEEGALIIEVRNPFDPVTSAPRKGTGFGLSSVQRRLYLLFARNDLLHTETENDRFTTRIKIPQP